MQRLNVLSQKNVVNIDDGVCLGKITDVELDEQSGRVSSVVISGKTRTFGLFGRQSEIVIPWELISRIGNDVILVRIGLTQGRKSAN